ncbi:fluoride efflux transporter CrcB [Solibacillus sp. A46]|uniref:Fluoride-specific ion channel FluC n=1 Tax=Solibacillus faecavium TaxID=2762221 RepID=A0ABR8XWR3_9BACL|nr:fluoride efflux transporter CrcB [Solibacillus faecavium]MBD8036393.1 fluoride efflux transporter CrcB [Solibacillus faecavium]
MAITNLLLVGIGGFFGAIARFSISKYLNNKTKYPIPIGTLTVNLLGSFLLGILIGAKADVMFVLLFGTGFMGAFTTFSTLKFEMTEMYVHKNKRKLLLYTALTYGLGIIFAYFGYLIGSY